MTNSKFDFDIIQTNPVDSMSSKFRMAASCKCVCKGKSDCYKSGYGSGYNG